MSDTRYADWKAPADDGQMLIWPDPEALPAETHQNQTRLSAATEVRLQGVPLPELRRRQREFIGHDDAIPLVATGHQTELYHCGVWVKNAMINAVARKTGGSAYHFAVDSDSPKRLHLRWPGGSRPITDDDALSSAQWTALLSPPTPQHLSYVAASLDDAAAEWTFAPATEPFFAAMRRQLLEPRDLAATLTNSIHFLEWELGLRHHALVVAPLWASEPYLVYVHHLVARAGEFAATYNAALADYRLRHGIRTGARPMPDLHVAGDEMECPFWLDDLSTGERSRATVTRREEGWRMAAPGAGEFLFLPGAEGWDAAARLSKWLREHQLRLAPRALTLTMFFRLLLADQFVHGIGGGRYDQVTDDVIRGHFTLEPPAFSVTTATLYFPTAIGQRRINLRPLLQEGRRIRHGLLSQEKMATVARIESLPRRSRERQELFFRMHQRLAAESNGSSVRQWEKRLREAEHESLRQRALFDRELFFAIQPAERLSGMIQRYDERFQ